MPSLPALTGSLQGPLPRFLTEVHNTLLEAHTTAEHDELCTLTYESLTF